MNQAPTLGNLDRTRMESSQERHPGSMDINLLTRITQGGSGITVQRDTAGYAILVRVTTMYTLAAHVEGV